MPRVDPDCTEELFEILGRIASHGFLLTGYFPVNYWPIRLSVLKWWQSNLQLPFLFNRGGKSDSRKGHVQESVEEILIDILSHFNVREIRSNPSDLRSLFIHIAKCEFVKWPWMLMTAFRRGMVTSHPNVWNKLHAVSIKPSCIQLQRKWRSYLSRMKITCPWPPAARGFSNILGDMSVVSPEIRCLSSLTLWRVVFTTLSGIQRRPIAHTCSAQVDLSTEYNPLRIL